jgi:hypothetical protein
MASAVRSATPLVLGCALAIPSNARTDELSIGFIVRMTVAEIGP